MAYRAPLGKGGKIVQKKKEESGPEVALAANARCVERLQAEVLSGASEILPPHSVITAILGCGDDGQFRVQVEKKRIVRQEELLLIQNSTGEAVVPARFLKNAGKKNAKLTCADLIKIGSVVSCYTARGCGSVKKACADKFAPTYITAGYAEIDYVLTAEKEDELGALGVCVTTKEETKKLVRENAAVPEEKRKPAMLSIQEWSMNFQSFLTSVTVPL